MPARRACAGKPCRPKSTRLLEQIYQVVGYHHYSYKTEQIYLRGSLRFIRFHGTRHPAETGSRKSRSSSVISPSSGRFRYRPKPKP